MAYYRYGRICRLLRLLIEGIELTSKLTIILLNVIHSGMHNSSIVEPRLAHPPCIHPLPLKTSSHLRQNSKY